MDLILSGVNIVMLWHIMTAIVLWQVFCLVLAGDAQSTRRLSEIFMAGCIPVFVGPPYNSMPLADDVHYKSIGVFFNISNYKAWLPEVRPADGAIKAAEAMLCEIVLSCIQPQSLLFYTQTQQGVTCIGVYLVKSGRVDALQQAANLTYSCSCILLVWLGPI